MRAQPLIAVDDVEASSWWYQRLLDCRSAHGASRLIPDYYNDCEECHDSSFEDIAALLQMVGVPRVFIDLMRLSPIWSKLEAIAHTLPTTAPSCRTISGACRYRPSAGHR